MKCKDCKYWVEAEGTKREENTGGCTWTYYHTPTQIAYIPKFLEEECSLLEPWKSENEKGHGLKK